MPAYDFRCSHCGAESTQVYPSVAAYSTATPTCPQCGHAALTRLIRGVSIARGASRDYARMSSQQMLSVLESGDARAAQQLFQQVQGGPPPAPQAAEPAPQPTLPATPRKDTSS